MERSTSHFLRVAALFLGTGVLAHTAPNPALPPPAHAEGELLVKFRSGPRGPAAAQAQARLKHHVIRNFHFIGWQRIRLPQGMTVQQGLTRYRNLPDKDQHVFTGNYLLPS